MFRWNGARQRTLREAAGLSREWLAIKIDRTAETVQAYELGRARPSLEAAYRIATELGVSIPDLLDEQEVAR